MARTLNDHQTTSERLDNRFINRICNHPILTRKQVAKLITASRAGRIAHAKLVVGYLHLITAMDCGGNAGKVRAARELVRTVNGMVGEGRVRTKTEIVETTRANIAANDDDRSPELAIERAIVNAAPLHLIPAIFGEVNGLAETLDEIRRHGATEAQAHEGGTNNLAYNALLLRRRLADEIRQRHVTHNERLMCGIIDRALALLDTIRLLDERKPAMQLIAQAHTGKAAEHEIVRCNGQLAVAIARRVFSNGLTTVPERAATMQFAMLRGVHRFDPERGLAFSTFITPWCISSEQEARQTARTISIGKRESATLLRMRILADKEGTTLSNDEVSELVRAPKSMVRTLQSHLTGFRSVDAPVKNTKAGGTDLLLGDTLPADGLTPEEHANAVERADLAHRLLRLVANPVDRDILLQRFGFADRGEEASLQEIGDLHGLSRERIRQRQNAVIERLRINAKQFGVTATDV